MKNATILQEAVHPIISSREIEVLKLISQGLTIKEIANVLFISPLTVAAHRRNMMRKLNSRNMACLVREGFERGILTVNQKNVAVIHKAS